MIQSYLKTAVRTLRKHWGFTAINVVGLAVGLAVALLALLFVRQQWRVDRFHPESDRIHRVTTLDQSDGMHYATAPRPLPTVLRESAPGVDAVAPVRRDGLTFVVHGESSLNVEAVTTTNAFWMIFSGFRVRGSSRAELLAEPRTAVVSEETARTLFGTDAAIGNTFRHEGETEYTVVGVLHPPDGPAHLEADVYLSSAGPASAQTDPDAWAELYSQLTYVRLSETASTSGFQATVNSLFEQYAREEDRADHRLVVQSLSDMRFGETLSNEVSGLLQLEAWVFFIMGGLAAVVLLAGGFNYVNLSVARSLRRAQEVSIRKTLGARRGQLMTQFLSEAVLTALLAVVGAMLLLWGLVPLFNDLYFLDLLGIPPLEVRALFEPQVLGLTLAIALVVGLLSGAYPAFVISTYRPARVLSGWGSSSSGTGPPWLRGALITAQVAFTLLLIVTATTMLRQTRHMATADHHLETDRVISVDLQDVSYDRFRRAVEGLPTVKEISAISNLMLGPSVYNSSSLRTARVDGPVSAVKYAVDTTYVRDMELPLRVTRGDWEQRFSSGEGLILNRSAVRALGYESDRALLGRQITSGDPERSTRTWTVVGVVQNFEFTGSGDIYGNMGRAADDPVMLYANPDAFNHALVRAGTNDLAAVRADLDRVWTQRLNTVHPFETRFYDDILRMRYGPLANIGYMIGSVALIAILIATLGLLSLAAYHVQTHVREIGIRKAVGATVTDVVVRLSRPFAMLVAGAAIAAAPLAWMLNRWWLQLMPDPVDVHVGVVLLCIVALVAGSLFTIATQTVRAARIDPARTLRNE